MNDHDNQYVTQAKQSAKTAMATTQRVGATPRPLPPSRTRLVTFVHISDLHIGDPDSTGNATLDAHTEAWLKRWPQFDGYLGHTGEALRHLDSFFDSLRNAEDADLIVTGDLTTVGKPSEFALVASYLTGLTHIGSALPLGLNVPDAFERTIPGNHDHWPGRRPRFALDPAMLGSSACSAQVFTAVRPGPSLSVYTPKAVPGSSATQIVFVRMNSDADVGPWSRERLGAMASFQSQLNVAQSLVQQQRAACPANTRQICVLLLHHSLGHNGKLLGMSKLMRRELNDFLVATRTHVLLTGHVHEPHGFVTNLKHGNVLEGRCGTTTQRDTVPPFWAPRRLPPNSLLVHRLYALPNRSVEWECSTYIRASGGFQLDPSQRPTGSFGALPSVQFVP